MIGKVVAKLSRRWPKLYRRIKAQDCQLMVRSLPHGVKVNTTFVDLNYRQLSPFSNPVVVYQVRNGDLLLWFIRSSQHKSEPFFLLPEGMLLARGFKRSNLAQLVIFKQHDCTEVTLIDQGRVVAQVVCPTSDDTKIQRTLLLLQREHGLENVDTQQVSAAEYDTMIVNGLESLGLRELSGVSRLQRTDYRNVVTWLGGLLPIALVAFVLFTFVQLSGTWLTMQKIDQLRSEFAGLQQELAPLLEKRNTVESRTAFWQKFVRNEMSTATHAEAYFLVAQAISYSGGQLNRYNGSKGKVLVTMVVENAALVADLLRDMPDFYRVRFEGPVSKDRKTGLQRAVLYCELADRESILAAGHAKD